MLRVLDRVSKQMAASSLRQVASRRHDGADCSLLSGLLGRAAYEAGDVVEKVMGVDSPALASHQMLSSSLC